MKFYLDENMSPKIAQIARRLGIDAVSAHDVNMTGTADEAQLDFAARQERCLVTFNRDDFIELSRMYFDASRDTLRTGLRRRTVRVRRDVARPEGRRS